MRKPALAWHGSFSCQMFFSQSSAAPWCACLSHWTALHNYLAPNTQERRSTHGCDREGEVGDFDARVQAQLQLIAVVQAPQAPPPPIAGANYSSVQCCSVQAAQVHDLQSDDAPVS